ncbi:MAG TPA: hypothetical protein VHA53_08445 [Nitrolancea sp.]|jgi:hypothetical protein|nr:hypothetical protein [Nitrolancea sp.]
MSQRASIDTRKLVDEIKRGLPAAPGQFSASEFDRLCDNIASAIASAIEEYDRSIKSPEPDFGEEERVADR